MTVCLSDARVYLAIVGWVDGHRAVHLWLDRSLTHSEPEVTNTQSPTCVCLALTSAILLSWAVAAWRPTGAPTRGSLKCRGPPTWRKEYCRCTSRQGPGGGEGGFVRMKGGAVAVQLFALPAQHQEKTQDLEESIFDALCVWSSRR